MCAFSSLIESSYTFSVLGYVNLEDCRMLTTVKVKNQPVNTYLFGIEKSKRFLCFFGEWSRIQTSKEDMFQPSLTHTLSEMNEITLRLHFVFYFHFIGLYELLAALPAQLQPHVDSQEDLTFLWDMFAEKSLHSLVKVNHADVRFSLRKNIWKNILSAI